MTILKDNAAFGACASKIRCFQKNLGVGFSSANVFACHDAAKCFLHFHYLKSCLNVGALARSSHYTGHGSQIQLFQQFADTGQGFQTFFSDDLSIKLLLTSSESEDFIRIFRPPQCAGDNFPVQQTKALPKEFFRHCFTEDLSKLPPREKMVSRRINNHTVPVKQNGKRGRIAHNYAMARKLPIATGKNQVWVNILLIINSANAKPK